MEKNFQLIDIDEMLIRMGLCWVTRLVYHPSTDSYKTAKLKDFDKQAILLVSKNGTNIHQHLKVELDNERFVYEIKFRGEKVDVSQLWQEVLGNTNQV